MKPNRIYVVRETGDNLTVISRCTDQKAALAVLRNCPLGNDYAILSCQASGITVEPPKAATANRVVIGERTNTRTRKPKPTVAG